MNRVKYPRTPHLPKSSRTHEDDIFGNPFEDKDIVVVTEKMDGENTTMYRDYIHARSLDNGYHWSRDWLKNFWGTNIAYQIPENMRICGENMMAVHSIKYSNLDSYFLGFSIWRNNLCLPWKTTCNLFREYGITSVPTLYQGMYGTMKVELDYALQEGYVVRKVDAFYYQDFAKNVAKYVRKNHIQTDQHWSKSTERNQLKNGN